jgi:Fe-S cluster assembly protein SufB
MNVQLAKENLAQPYQAGFETVVPTKRFPVGLSASVVASISAIKQEPEWMLEARLDAYRRWQSMLAPTWGKLRLPEIDFQSISYYSAPKAVYASLAEVDPAILRDFERLGVPLHERSRLAGVAVDAVFDSVSIGTTYQEKLKSSGVIFCSMSQAIREHPKLVRQYLGSVVGPSDNFYASLNAAVFSDGSFVYIPPGVKCPMDLSTYFRINDASSGQFERTLIIADRGSSVSYLEGCTAPVRSQHQLHAAVVELIAMDDAVIHYATVQNWYPGNEDGLGGILNFVTKRGQCRGARSQIHWTQVETGSAITWKYPSCVLLGDDSVGSFRSIAITKNSQQADTGTKMIHAGARTKSTIISKGISAGRGENTYRGLVKIMPSASDARNHTQCDSLLTGKNCGAHTFPSVEVRNSTSICEHEATTGRVSQEQIDYCRTRGLSAEQAVTMIVQGFCRPVLDNLPMEFALEARKLLEVNLEGSIG